MAGQTGYAFALAHADDGVIWGRFDQGQWAWSSGIAPASPKLHAITLQQLRLFGANGELFLWRSGAGFVGRTIEDNVGESIDWFDEEHLLWGKADGQTTIAFQLMREGAQGLLHAPPTEIAAKGKLITRNYIDYDADGDYDADSCAYVKASRLVVKE
jgi:CRISPR-associated protein (TIGR03984 family)